jgi:methionine sulfoxide reductase catalytic subunit
MSESTKIKSSQITDEQTYLNRRNFMRLGLLAGSSLATGLAYRYFQSPPSIAVETAEISTVKPSESVLSEVDKPNTFREITNYNNYYEFSTNKTSVADAAKDFVTRPWTVEVDGLVEKPQTFDIDDLLKIEQEERIYRFRCVEGWSMVIPWVGFPLKKLLDKVQPLSKAKYVSFETYFDKKQMPNWARAGIDLPYVEGLRLDEAMHPLTILATGLYGKQMPNQNGAPIRLVVPWKYGFKSIKSVVRIVLTETEPATTWNLAAPDEYGFYSNVNPNVSHPRWSQADEQRIGEFSRRKTLMFNGYEEEVGGMYSDLDLKKQF